MSKTSQARKGGRPSSLLEAKFDGMTLCTQFFDFPSLTSWTKAGISFSFFSSFSVSFFKAALIFFLPSLYINKVAISAWSTWCTCPGATSASIKVFWHDANALSMKLGLGLLQSMAWKFAKAQGSNECSKKCLFQTFCSEYLYQKTNAMALKMGSQRNIKIQRYLSHCKLLDPILCHNCFCPTSWK